MKAMRPAKVAKRVAAFLAAAGREPIAVVEAQDRDDTRGSPDRVDFVAMPFASLPADFPSEAIAIPVLQTYIADGLVGSGTAGVALRANPPRQPPVALLRAADYQRLTGADFSDLHFVELG